MSEESKTKTRPGEPGLALAAFGRAVDRLAAVLAGDSAADTAVALDGIMASGSVATVGVLDVALRRAGTGVGKRSRLIRLVAAVGTHPKARRPALSLLCDALQDESNRGVATTLALAFAGLKPTPEELMDYTQAAAASPGSPDQGSP